MVDATAVDTAVIPSKPTRLQIAAMMMAGNGLMALVPTTVAMALGASVAPLTMVAPIASTTMTASTGSLTSAPRNDEKSIPIFLPPEDISTILVKAKVNSSTVEGKFYKSVERHSLLARLFVKQSSFCRKSLVKLRQCSAPSLPCAWNTAPERWRSGCLRCGRPSRYAHRIGSV